MLNKIGIYYHSNSLVHKMNSFIKMLCVILFIIMIFFANNLKTNVVIFILATLMVLNTKVPVRIYFKMILSIKWLLLFIIIINFILKLPLEFNVMIIVRIIYIIIYMSILFFTTPFLEIISGFEVLFYPLKLFCLPVDKMALSTALFLNSILLMIQGNKILKSKFECGYNKIKTLLKLIIKRNYKLINLMKIRLYGINQKRTNFRQNKVKFYDLFILLLHVAILVLAVKGVLV